MKIFAILLTLIASSCYARDLGQWKDNDTSRWYKELMQPDIPTASCCGEADAYWCDNLTVRDGKPSCIITDDRDIPHRPKVELGTIIEIPNNKLKWDSGNPTGHGIVFMSGIQYVFCYVRGLQT